MNLAACASHRQPQTIGHLMGMISATAAVLTCCSAIMSPASGQRAGAGTWKQYHDSDYNFTLSIPAGWTVQTDARRIVIATGDRAAFALIENFVPQGDETAEDHVDDLPKTDATLLSGCKVDEHYTLDAPVKKAASNGGAAEVGEQAVGIISYNDEKGPGKARVLCLVFPKGGLLFGLAASNDRFAAEQPTMLRILQSFRFSAPSPGTTTGADRKSSSGGSIAAPTSPTGAADQLNNIKYEPFTDSKERAFSLDIPQSWTKDGGTVRASIMDTRVTIMAHSPNNEIAVMLGDAGLSGFVLPSHNPNIRQQPEGTVVTQPNAVHFTLMHYMPAAEFNRWYLTHFMNRTVDDLEIGNVANASENGQAKRAGAGAGGNTSSESETTFTCRNKLTGRKMSGVLSSLTSVFIGNVQGEGNWKASPMLYLWASDDSKASAREAVAKTVFTRMQSSFKLDPTWAANENSQRQQFIAALTNKVQGYLIWQRQEIAQSEVRAKRAAEESDERREKMMGDFNDRMAAKDYANHKVVEGILDQKDVTDGTTTWKVSSNYSYYYKNSAGDIYGTNDKGYPELGFSQLGNR